MELKDIKVVKQPRRLTHGLYRLSVTEKRIVMRIIESLQPELNGILKSILKGNVKVSENLLGDKIIRLPTKCLIPEGSRNHPRLKQALNELPLRRINLKCYDEEKGPYEVYTGFILQSRFFERNSVVEIQISKDMLPIYLGIVNGYTVYKLPIAFELSSVNTIRLYEMLSSWISDPFEKTIMFEDLKQKLGLENRYPNSAQFKKKVLEPAIKELKEKADIWFSLKEPIKEGRKVVGWQIQIHKRKEVEARAKKLEATTRTGRANILAPAKRKPKPSLEEIEISKNKLLESLQKETKQKDITYNKYTNKFNLDETK